MTQTMTTDQLLQARGRPVYAADGARLGEIEEIYVDNDTEAPEWLALGAGTLGTKRVLVPVAGAAPHEDGFRVPYSEDQVSATPEVDSDEISQDFEAKLYSHYGLEYSERRSDSGLPQGGAPESASVGEADVVRTEEEIAVNKRPVETGRVRLRKSIETEPVSVDVDLQRETARVRREPIDRPVDDVELGEDEVEMPLRGEEAVVDKQAVARERITLDKDVETERETVKDEVRKERVDVEGDVDSR